MTNIGEVRPSGGEAAGRQLMSGSAVGKNEAGSASRGPHFVFGAAGGSQSVTESASSSGASASSLSSSMSVRPATITRRRNRAGVSRYRSQDRRQRAACRLGGSATQRFTEYPATGSVGRRCRNRLEQTDPCDPLVVPVEGLRRFPAGKRRIALLGQPRRERLARLEHGLSEQLAVVYGTIDITVVANPGNHPQKQAT